MADQDVDSVNNISTFFATRSILKGRFMITEEVAASDESTNKGIEK
jgi:hypothetical protein